MVQIDTVGVEIGNEIKQLHEAARGKGREIASDCRETSFRAEAHQITSKVRLPRYAALEHEDQLIGGAQHAVAQEAGELDRARRLLDACVD